MNTSFRPPPQIARALRRIVPVSARERLRGLRRPVHEAIRSDRHSRPSLHGIETKLDRLLGRSGFFIEAGAFNGFDQSNTYWLERFRGWRGVLVEPVPSQAEACRKLRRRSTTVQAALVGPDHDGAPVSIRYAGLMSIAVGARGSAPDDDQHIADGLRIQPGVETFEVEVPARTLTSVLHEAGAPRDIDLLSLDVEGYEASVLAGLDTTEFEPRYVLVEVNDHDALDKQLTAMGYELVDPEFTPRDALYRRRGVTVTQGPERRVTDWVRLNRVIRRRLRVATLDAIGRPQSRGDLQRLGSDYGGWIVPLDLLETGAVCVAAGVGEDTTFDAELVERGCVVHALDPTPRAIAHVESLPLGESFHFHPVGLWDESTELRFYAPTDPNHVSHSIVNLQKTTEYFVAPVITLASLLEDLGQVGIDLLKLDIEGAEHRVLAHMRHALVRPQIVCVEFDQPSTLWAMARELVAMRRYGYQLVVRDGWNFTFVRRDLL